MPARRAAAALFLAMILPACGQTYISEIFFNPPSSDAPNQYIELRGQPNRTLASGSYLVAVHGDAASDPGTVCNVFDLSGRVIGGNGFLVLFQKDAVYTAHPYAKVLANTGGTGWGSGSSSSIGHQGENESTDLPHASVTFLLIQSTTPPVLGDDIDGDDNGTPDGAVWAGWTILDSVGVLDADGAGDAAYGRISFRRSTFPGKGAAATGTIIPIGFTPSYVGRTGNTTGYAAGDWVASDNLPGAAPNWSLSDGTTTPSAYDAEPLNHIGKSNFGAAALHGVVAVAPVAGLPLAEGGEAASYRVGLNTLPAGAVTVQATAPAGLELSTDGGVTWGATRSRVFTTTNLQTIAVRALEDNTIDTTPHLKTVRHAITASADATRYPVGSPGPAVDAAITDQEFLLFNEIKVNPPGTNDGPWEYIELRGNPGVRLTNIYFLSIESSGSKNPGKANLVIDLSSSWLGSAGLLAIGATNRPYSIPGTANYFGDPRFNQPDGILGNGSRSFLLVSSPRAIEEGLDLDGGDNGILEELPAGTTLLDSIAWSDGSTNDVLYGPALNLSNGLSDAALRLPARNTPNTAEGWVFGDLLGETPGSLDFDPERACDDFPFGTPLTPGRVNSIAPSVSPLRPLSGVIGDPTNPKVYFSVTDSQPSQGTVWITASSSNPAVVPDTNLVLTPNGPGQFILAIDPVGVGYSTITLWATNSLMTGFRPFAYAASEMGRAGGDFLTGMCDASAAAVVSDDLMFVGDDENQTIRLYPRHQSAAPIAGFDFSEFLNLTEFYSDGRPKEMDIEGVARVGNRLLWVGSGSNAEWGEAHPNRNRVMATDLTVSGTNSQLSYVGRYEFLKQDILNWDANNLHGKGANYYGLVASAAPGVNPKEEDCSGYNIEAVTMAPGSSHIAYIGFRAPCVPLTNRAKALILVITNFPALAASGAAQGATRFGPPIELNLGRRGIRAMDATSNGVVIVAGPPGPATEVAPKDLKLFTWAGWTNPPQQRAADLSGTTVEALLDIPPGPLTSNTTVQVLSDNGVTYYYGDGVPAKKLPVPEFKKFRSDWVALGPIVTPEPVIRTLPSPGNAWVLSWYSVEGLTYVVQWAASLEPGAWTDLPGAVTATDAISAKTVPPMGTSQCFFRVIVR